MTYVDSTFEELRKDICLVVGGKEEQEQFSTF
jgi:hypothetical protein